MGRKLYKYIGPKILEKCFSLPRKCTLKCALPSTYNDPYELFMTVDYRDEPDVMAFYKDVLEEVPEVPTTCFSTSPIITPMWAHYAHSLCGFVLELDEDLIRSHIDGVHIYDVEYRDSPDPGISGMLHHAYETGKPRHTVWLIQQLLRSAYTTKQTCWAYENEVRMLVVKESIREVDGMILFDVHDECITGLIAGARVLPEYEDICMGISDRLGVAFYKFCIGKSSVVPYLRDISDKRHIWQNGSIEVATKLCGICKEPIYIDGDLCPICRITQRDEDNARKRNPMRMLSSAGLLESYIKGMGRNQKKES